MKTKSRKQVVKKVREEPRIPALARFDNLEHVLTVIRSHVEDGMLPALALPKDDNLPALVRLYLDDAERHAKAGDGVSVMWRVFEVFIDVATAAYFGGAVRKGRKGERTGDKQFLLDESHRLERANGQYRRMSARQRTEYMWKHQKPACGALKRSTVYDYLVRDMRNSPQLGE